MPTPRRVRTEILCSPEFVQTFRTFAESKTSEVEIRDVSMKKDRTELQFGIVEVAAIVTIIQGSVYLGKEMAQLLGEWLKDNPREKIVIRTLAGHEELSSELDESEILEYLKLAAGL